MTKFKTMEEFEELQRKKPNQVRRFKRLIKMNDEEFEEATIIKTCSKCKSQIFIKDISKTESFDCDLTPFKKCIWSEWEYYYKRGNCCHWCPWKEEKTQPKEGED